MTDGSNKQIKFFRTHFGLSVPHSAEYSFHFSLKMSHPNPEGLVFPRQHNQAEYSHVRDMETIDEINKTLNDLHETLIKRSGKDSGHFTCWRL